MNKDSFKCVMTLLKNVKTFTVYILIAESKLGEHTFYGLAENEKWEYLFSPDRLEQYKMRNYKFLHLFSYSFVDDLKWVESKDLENQDCIIPIDLTDDVVKYLVAKSNEAGITVNEVMVDILRDYINEKVNLNDHTN